MTENYSQSPTVALVHGAFADGGSFAAVTELLLAAGVKVQALVNPLRGLAVDSAYVASALAQITGPVLAVGHSYGGAVITNAATTTPNVVGLVFIAGFAPDENEVLGEVEGTSRDSALGPALVQAQYPTGVGDETATELYVNPGRVPRSVRGRPPGGAGRCVRRFPAARRRRRFRGEVRRARVEDAPVVGRRRDR